MLLVFNTLVFHFFLSLSALRSTDCLHSVLVALVFFHEATALGIHGTDQSTATSGVTLEAALMHYITLK